MQGNRLFAEIDGKARDKLLLMHVPMIKAVLSQFKERTDVETESIGCLATSYFIAVVGFQLQVCDRDFLHPVTIHVLYPCHVRQVSERKGNYGYAVVLRIHLENAFGSIKSGILGM